MAAREIDWAKFIAEDSEIPPDVTFAVMEQVKDTRLFSVWRDHFSRISTWRDH